LSTPNVASVGTALPSIVIENSIALPLFDVVP
jgi:hypothetical protein